MNEKLPELQISSKIQNIPQALSIYFNQLVYSMRQKGIDITTLSLGEAYFDIPLFDFSEIDTKKGNHYSESIGLYDLRKKIAEYYLKNYGAEVDFEKEILISAGSKPIIFMIMQAILNEGDEVLMPEPAWLSYPEQVKLANGTPKFIPYQKSIYEYEEYITEKTKIFIINNPNNPAGKLYSEEELKYLYEICRRRGIYLMCDEAYSDFVVDEKFVSLANIVKDKDGIIVVNSLSKNLGISGWRIGYVISSTTVIENVLKLNQHLITCAPTLLQMYLAHYFDKLIDITLPQAKEVVRKRNLIRDYIEEIGLSSLGGTSTFYTLINIGDYKYSSLDFALYLLFKYHIAVVPGNAYGTSVERFVRCGIGVESVDNLKNALNIIKKVIDNNEFDDTVIENGLKELNEKRFVDEN